jgi:phosphoribosylformylglycinamidine cyclo-ligase
MAHITGGGLPGNLDRALPASIDAHVDSSSWETPLLFRALQEAGGVSTDEMYRVFNMGVGMVAIARATDADEIIGAARVAGVIAWVMGDVRPGSGSVNVA